VNAGPVSIPEFVPVFPLPEVVLFPRQILPLHIFEPRYRAMVADALAGERLIAIALLKPDYEPLYFTPHAPIHRLVGVGRIVATERLDDGKYNILLRGQTRAKLLAELPGRPYRLARIETVASHCDASPAVRERLRRKLWAAARRYPVSDLGWCEMHSAPCGLGLSLGELTDLITARLPISGELRQSLLAELDVCPRARKVLGHIQTLASVARPAREAEHRSACNLN